MAKEKKTQRSEILRYLKSHKRGLTSQKANDLFGSTRLASHICVLRKRGYDIETIEETTKNRYGSTTNFARYILHEN